MNPAGPAGPLKWPGIGFEKVGRSEDMRRLLQVGAMLGNAIGGLGVPCVGEGRVCTVITTVI